MSRTRRSVVMGARTRMLEDEKTPVATTFRVATWLIDRFDRLKESMREFDEERGT